MLNEIYTKYWSDYFNYFIPSEKLLSKQRVGARTIKIHDKPKTPFQRLLESKHVSTRVKKELTKRFKQLNPFELEVEIHARIIEILNLN